ncbi:MAG: chlorite dismutase family protein [Solirubrobacterales bacterium]
MDTVEIETAAARRGSAGGLDPTQTAIGTWSGGNFLPFGVRLEEERLRALLRPDAGVRTVLSADVYGCGAADTMLGRALEGVPRQEYCLLGAVGHDFYEGSRVGRGGFQRFTDPALRGPDQYAGYLRMATERSLERCGADCFDVLLLHNPDRTGYTSEAVWEGMRGLREAGLCRRVGIAPGPDNGFVLDQIACLERFGEQIDWAMLILNPFEPWPVEHVLAAMAAHEVRVITRVADHGGVFWGDVRPGHAFPPGDHRTFRPPGWVEAANQKLDAIRPIGERHGLTPLQLACAWNLSHEAVACVAPTLLQELGPQARPVEEKRAELAAVAPDSPLSAAEVEEIRRLGDNTGSVPLKGASRQYSGVERADQWQMTPALEDVAARWGIDPDRDLQCPADPRDMRERGASRAGVPQTLDQRLYMQLQALVGVPDAAELVQALRRAGAAGVVYESAAEPGLAALLLLDGDPGALLEAARAVAADAAVAGAERRRELTMYGRTYGSGHEPDLEDWLLRAPPRKLAAPENEWAVWYPLRRSADFYRLGDRDRGRVLAEHGKVGRTFVEAGYADDVRLECFGLDPADNEFVIGLLGSRLDRLSRLVKAMRPTEHTARYIERLGPFFVGRRAGHTLD